ncbi:DUF7344 domain-containing protein [Halobacterium wangiae]|uniref:DUF7344 domain-containing protein n=1 Tax=Halobacterium wangiae TaxID=2902623 RepID=UPI001E5BAAF8|nr:hypothetical protein [Halobacterium wangiae]
MTNTTAGDPEKPPAAAELSEHDQYRLLANERRRVTVDVLADQSSPLTLGELATAVDARENDLGSERQRVLEVRLHHVHLPMLADAGVLDYDPETNRVEPRASRLEALTR